MCNKTTTQPPKQTMISNPTKTPPRRPRRRYSIDPMYLLWTIRFLSLVAGTVVSPSVRPMLTARLGIRNFGLLQSLSNAAALCSATIVGRVSDAKGSRIFALVGGSVVALLGFILFFGGHLSFSDGWGGGGGGGGASVMIITLLPCIGRILQMMSQSVLGGITQAAASDIVGKKDGAGTGADVDVDTTAKEEQAKERRPSSSTTTGKNIALVRSAIGFGVATGAAVGGRLTKINDTAPLVAGLMCTIINVGAAFLIATSGSLQAPPQTTTKNVISDKSSSDKNSTTNSTITSIKSLLTELLASGSNMLTLLSLQFLCSLAFYVFTSTWDIALSDRLGYNAAEFSYMVSAVGWLFAFVQMFVVPYFVSSGNFSRNPSVPLRLGLIIAAVGRFGLAAADSTSSLVLSFAILALGQGTVGTLLSTLVAREAPTRAGYYLGLSEGARGVAGVVGPMLGAALYEMGGSRAPAAIGGVFQIIACIMACILVSAGTTSSTSSSSSPKETKTEIRTITIGKDDKSLEVSSSCSMNASSTITTNDLNLSTVETKKSK